MNSWTFYVPDSHPTPSFILLVLGFLFLVYFGLVALRLRGARLASCFVAALHAPKACITSEGERRETRLPPFKIIITIAFRIPRV